MKKRIALLAVACMMFASMGIFAACGEDETPSVGGGDNPSQIQPGTDDPTPSHTHVYGAWEIVTKPTSQQGGKAKRTCNENDDTQELDLPALTNETFWTKDTTASQAPTHTAAGKNVYKNAEHNLTVEEDVAADADAHDYTGVEWTVKTKPTQTQEGSAERKCTGCDHVDTLTLPNLATASFWTLDEEASEPATHTAAGKNVYKNAEHNITVEEDVAANADAHTYGEWSWKNDVEPTLEEGATATRSCTTQGCSNPTQEVEVPALSDTEVWAKETTKPASHTEKGEDTYTSEYGEVLVETDKIGGHQWGAWSWVEGNEPTADKAGKAEHSCEIVGCGVTEQVDVAALSSTDEWNSAVTPATYNEAGKTVYTHKTYEGLTIEVPISKRVAPYDGKTYYGGIAVDLFDSDSFKTGVPSVTDSWVNQVELDANGVGIGKGAPFTTNSQFHFTMKDEVTGELEIIEIPGTKVETDDGNDDDYGDEEENWGSSGDEVYEYETATPKTRKGYVDFTSGLIIMPQAEGSDLTYFHIVSPYGAHHNNSGDITVKLSVWGTGKLDYSVAITYTYKVEQETKSVNIYLHNDEVVFGVAFTDIEGETVAAENCYNADQLYVTKGAETLASVGYKAEGEGGSMVVLDGLEGTYTETEETFGTLVLDGKGGATLTKEEGDPMQGTYTKVSNGVVGVTYSGADGKMHYVQAELTAGEAHSGTYVGSTANVTVTYNANVEVNTDDGVTAPAEAQNEKLAPMDLAEMQDTDNFFFKGWTTDPAGEEPVELGEDGKYYPADDVTLYAKWAKAIHVSVQMEYEASDDGEEATSHKVPDGDSIADFLNGLIENKFNAENGHSFNGWRAHPTSGEDRQLGESDLAQMFFNSNYEGMTFIAQWKYTPYVGEYYGANLDGTSGPDNVSSSTSSYYLKFAEDGKMSGKFSGTVEGYSDGIITVTSGNSTYYFFFDETTGLLATGAYSSATSQYITHDMALYSRTQKKFEHRAINVPNPSNPGTSQGVYARFVEAEVTVQNDGADPTTKTIIVLLYNTKIYSNITVTDAFGTAITNVADIANSKTVIVKDNSTGAPTQILAKGSVGNNLSSGNTADLDALYGTYTWADHETLKLDGAGTAQLVQGDTVKAGTYKAVQGSDNKIDLYIIDGDEEVYYEVTLVKGNENTYTSEKIMVSVDFNYGPVENPTGKLTEASFNKNIELELPALTDPTGEYLFRGWFKDASFEQECDNETLEDVKHWSFTPTENGTKLYAKWIKKVTITVHYNDNNTTQDKVIDTLGDGETLELPRPAYEGHKFGGWFTDDATFAKAWGTVGDDHVTSGVLSAETATTLDLYAKWEGAPAYSGEYKLYYLDGSKANGGVDTADTYSKNIVIDAEGYAPSVSGTVYPFSGNNMQVQSYEAESGEMVFQRDGYSTTFNAFFDSTKKIIAFINYSDEVVLMVPADAGEITVKSSYWGEDGGTRAITITIAEEEYGVFMMANAVTLDVTFTDMSGAPVKAEEAYTATSFYVKKGEEVIARFGSNGETMVELDGNEGTYTLSGNTVDELPGTLTLNGVSTATFGENKVGSYEIVSDTVVGIYLDGKYYEATLDKSSAKTFNITKPELQITFQSAQGLAYGDSETLTDGNYNKNIEAKIPALKNTATHVFRGWFTTEDFQESTMLTFDEDGYYLFTPTGNEAITLYAKWLEKVTVKVHYQKDGVEDVTLELGKGEEARPMEPGFTDGQAFKEWRLGSPDGSVWASGTEVEENIEIYCVWQDAHKLYGSWVGAEIYGQADKGGSMSGGTSAKNASVTVQGTISGSCANGTITDWDDENGTFKVGTYYGAYDKKNGIIIVDYYANTPVGYDYYIFIKSSVTSSFLMTQSKGCYWNGSVKGSTKLAEMTLADGSTMNIFIYEGRVWGKVTFEGTPIEGFSDELTAGNVWQKAQTLVVKDSDGKVIASFVRGANGLEYSDGFGGTYTGTKGEEEQQDLILDGKGGASWAGRQGTYFLLDDVENGIEIYLEASGDKPAEYWTVVVDKSGQSYTATMPMVQLTLVLRDEAGAETLATVQKSVNKYIPFALSATHEELVSAGWYTDETLQEAVTLDENGLYKPTEEATLYAKMVGKVTLTIVYGTEHGNLGTLTVDLPKNSTPDLTKYVPEPQGTYVFGGWYEDEACEETPYEVGPLTASKTIYCKWIEQQYEVELDPASGNWTEDNGVYTIGHISSTNVAAIKITFSAKGTFSFDWEGVLGGDSYIVYAKNPSSTSMLWSSGSLGKASGTVSKTTQNVSVESGDIVYILVYEFYSSVTSAQVSNFSFVAG